MTITQADLLGNDVDADGDGLSLHWFDDPEHGTLVFVSEDRALIYTPPAGFFGTDNFRYEVFDGQDHSSPATVSITVGEPTESAAPTANSVLTGLTVDDAEASAAIIADPISRPEETAPPTRKPAQRSLECLDGSRVAGGAGTETSAVIDESAEPANESSAAADETITMGGGDPVAIVDWAMSRCVGRSSTGGGGDEDQGGGPVGRQSEVGG